MNYLLKAQSIQRALVLAIALATITVMSGIGSLGTTATAQTSTQIVDGSLIRAHNDIDIYIVKIVGSKLFKRLRIVWSLRMEQCYLSISCNIEFIQDI